jgi:hypothetical protein
MAMIALSCGQTELYGLNAGWLAESARMPQPIRRSGIGGDFYDRFAGEWREEQLRLQREIDRHEAAEQSYMDRFSRGSCFANRRCAFWASSRIRTPSPSAQFRAIELQLGAWRCDRHLPPSV